MTFRALRTQLAPIANVAKEYQIQWNRVNSLYVLIFIVHIGEGIIPATWLNWGLWVFYKR
jgi:hypothetical protein